MSKALLIIFVKNPRLGHVKTRLAKTIGDEAALSTYHKLLQHTQEITESLAVDKVVCYDQFIDHEDLWDDALYRKDIQVSGDLGVKMSSAFQRAFQQGYEKVVIIGSDCYEMSENTLKAAFELLSETPAVIGPSTDGGYYLLGLRQFVQEVFEGIAWSTDTVTKETLKALEKQNLQAQLLSHLTDIDEWEDLKNTVPIEKRQEWRLEG